MRGIIWMSMMYNTKWKSKVKFLYKCFISSQHIFGHPFFCIVHESSIKLPLLLKLSELFQFYLLLIETIEWHISWTTQVQFTYKTFSVPYIYFFVCTLLLLTNDVTYIFKCLFWSTSLMFWYRVKDVLSIER